jgi:hypothetical protein
LRSVVDNACVNAVQVLQIKLTTAINCMEFYTMLYIDMMIDFEDIELIEDNIHPKRFPICAKWVNGEWIYIKINDLPRKEKKKAKKNLIYV